MRRLMALLSMVVGLLIGLPTESRALASSSTGGVWSAGTAWAGDAPASDVRTAKVTPSGVHATSTPDAVLDGLGLSRRAWPHTWPPTWPRTWPRTWPPTWTEQTPEETDTRITQRRCCKICRAGKACGDSCIARSKTCRAGPGCACDAN